MALDTILKGALENITRRLRALESKEYLGSTDLSTPGTITNSTINATILGVHYHELNAPADLNYIWRVNPSPVIDWEMFERSSAGLVLALATAVAGSVVYIPPGTYSTSVVFPAIPLVIPTGVEVQGWGLKTVLLGQITGGAAALLRAVRVVINASNAAMQCAIMSPATGVFYLEECSVEVDNAVGDAIALYSNAEGTIEARRCFLRGVSATADGWAAYSIAGGGAGLLTHCSLVYTTAPTGVA